MSLSEEAMRRLADIVELQPTKNGELQERWGLDSGSAVHQYLEAELSEYYYRDEDSLIRATPDAAELVGGEADTTVRLTAAEADIIAVLARPDERAQSVVSVLHDLREVRDADPATDALRRRLKRLADRGLVEVVRRTVPTYKLAVDPDTIDVRVTDKPDPAGDSE